VLTYQHDEDHLDADSLVAAVRAAHAGHVAAPPSVDDRRRQRAEVADAHALVHGSVVGRR
jgi:beta-1,4-mannosyltransferase